MKIFQQNSKKWAIVIGIMSLLAVSLSSCYKNDYYSVSQPGNNPQQVAAISVYNASPDSQPLDVYLDNNLVNNFPIAYGHKVNYVNAYPGKRVASFYVSSTQQKVASDTLSLNPNLYYSLFWQTL